MKPDELARAVTITSIPLDLDEEILEISLENRRNGGGDIKEIHLNRDDGTALVIFADVEGICCVSFLYNAFN